MQIFLCPGSAFRTWFSLLCFALCHLDTSDQQGTSDTFRGSASLQSVIFWIMNWDSVEETVYIYIFTY